METTMIRKNILQDKLDSLLSRKKEHVFKVLETIETDTFALEDNIVPFGPASPLGFVANGTFKASMNGEEFKMHNNAFSQMCTLFGIPSQYGRTLLETEWGRKLLKDIFTEHNDHSFRKRMLVRSVNDEIRGVLSDKYRRLDSRMIYQTFLEKAIARGAEVSDAHYTKTKQYITVLFPKVYEIKTENNGIVYSAFGARICNSDFGNSALHLNAFVMNCVCDNGLVTESLLNARHLGSRLSANLNLSQRTYELDTRTMASAVKDITSNILDEKVILKNASAIKKASSEIIDMDNAIKKLPKTVHKLEIEGVKKILQDGDESRGIYGKPTTWKLSQAITAHSNDLGGSRKRELDEIAGKILGL